MEPWYMSFSAHIKFLIIGLRNLASLGLSLGFGHSYGNSNLKDLRSVKKKNTTQSSFRCTSSSCLGSETLNPWGVTVLALCSILLSQECIGTFQSHHPILVSVNALCVTESSLGHLLGEVLGVWISGQQTTACSYSVCERHYHESEKGPLILFCSIIPTSNFHSPYFPQCALCTFRSPRDGRPSAGPHGQPARLSPSPLQELPFAETISHHYSEHLGHRLFWTYVQIAFHYIIQEQACQIVRLCACSLSSTRLFSRETALVYSSSSNA